MVLLKIAAHWEFACCKVAKKLRSHGFLLRNSARLHQVHSLHSSATKCSLEGREGQTLVCDFHGTLLGTPSLFPYFMLVAFEGGSLLRAFLLLLLSPLLWVLGNHREITMRILVFVTFCGLRTKHLELVSRAVLPKFYLENLHLQACELLAATGMRVVLTSMPRLMVEGFLKEYLGVSEVVGAELQVVRGCYFTGLISGSTLAAKQKALKDIFGEAKADVALVSSSNLHDHLFITYCKETFVVNKEEDTSGISTEMPRTKYPKPLVFHDGRLALLPTPSATLAVFMWLPIAIPLAIIRIAMGIIFPYRVTVFIGALIGIRFAVGRPHTSTSDASTGSCRKGELYVCTHRTLLDPVILCIALQRPVPAVTYSLSRMSEILAPMKTVRLTRDRKRDAATIRRLLCDGDLAVCPEGTTCREPYLLRFSSLFAELAENIVPVAMDARVGMFYGTTASGRKWLDPVVFMLNPLPVYTVDILERVPPEMTCAGGLTATEVANRIQKQLADALGFECTAFTRRDKYMILAGNEGVVSNQCEGRVVSNQCEGQEKKPPK
ncbi:glycerol-3-phosphate acyltransferase 1-like [Musa acuminata AAA Group]|uniref:glycerol-3-phosphate acyltransferase 1-like n=1 Tax=Musa acuminata AAA Group TaxID=214697 RepID=UPI0031D52720